LEEIWCYIVRDSPRAADRLIQKINNAIDDLADMPAMRRLRERYGPGLRSFTVARNYRIFYQPIEGGVEVTRVIHGARDLDREFGVGGE
jgi:toxin ParE1/3/4